MAKISEEVQREVAAITAKVINNLKAVSEQTGKSSKELLDEFLKTFKAAEAEVKKTLGMK
jgi:hypothetical protein